MIKGMYNAAKSMLVRQKNIEIIANNLANINTNAYKRELPFAEVLGRAGEEKKIQLTDMRKGNLTKTTNKLDLALTTETFFMVKTERGTELTSNGRFKISDDGYLVNDDGYKVLGQQGEINLYDVMTDQEKQLNISKTGEIKLGEDIVDKLVIAKIDDQSKMQRTTGATFYFPEEDGYSIANEEDYEVLQGYVEESNINPILEMQSMISINKDYEASQKMINSLDEVLRRARELGRV